MSAAAVLKSLTPAERRAVVPLTFFSEKVGQSMIRKGIFESANGWPMTPLGVAVLALIDEEARAALSGSDPRG